jgi:ElaB/YqjD/DUF883 family membrane-anchored ribosome-binding protein
MDINESAKYAKKNENYLKDELRDDFKRVKDTACDACGAIYDTASHAKEKARKAVKNSLDGLQQQSTEIQENVVKYVKENPVKSVCYAILAGLLTSHILRK